jgi:hypothetical protein
MMIIRSYNDWVTFITTETSGVTNLCFLDIEDIIDISYALPPNVHYIQLENSPNVRFRGNHLNYSAVEAMAIRQRPPILNFPDFSSIRPKYLYIYFSPYIEDGAKVVLAKENLVIPYELQLLHISNCTLNTDSLSNVLNVSGDLEFNNISGIFPIPSKITKLRFKQCNPITFTNEFPIELYDIYLNQCELTPALANQICNLDLRRRRRKLPRLIIRVLDQLRSPSFFCPENFYPNMHNDLTNIALLSNQLPDAYKHIQSFISGGTRKKKRGLKLKKKRGSRYRKRATNAKRNVKSSKARNKKRYKCKTVKM